MTKILTPTAEHDVAARDGLWMSPADAETVTGWTLKPEGMCRAEA
ncbi:MAG TPA: redoxin domain-containing (seleno)protein, partial [Reyranella sp.]|nr:redoxin domain-containing (seleno)protein [Reyranella sp.]